MASGRIFLLTSVITASWIAAPAAASESSGAASEETGYVLEEPGVITELLDSGPGQSGLDQFSGWDEGIPSGAEAILLDGASDEDEPEPIAVPEPSAMVLLGGLAALLAAMTYLRWHFDQATAVEAVEASIAE